MDEAKDDSKKSSESPIEIIVTEESEDEPNINESNAASESEETNAEEAEREASSSDSEKETLKVLELDITTIQELDKHHNWLSELEEKCLNLETAFISKIQYVAVSNHCQRVIDELKSEESMAQFRIEYNSLFEKFRTVFTGSLQLSNKVQEMRGYNNLSNAENRKLKIKLEEKYNKMEEMQRHMEMFQNNLIEKEKEKVAILKLFEESKKDTSGESWKQEQVRGNKTR